jgi:hypothetical protein
MNKNIQNSIEKVSNSFPSLFSREDVIKLLTDLNAEMQEESPKLLIEKDALVDIFREVYSNKRFDDAVDSDYVEFSISYDNRIVVDNVPINEDFIVGAAVEALEASWDSLEEVIKEN